MFEVTKKEKILAIFIIIFLLIFAGVLLFSISLNNKHRTEDLRKKVLEIKHARENRENFNSLSYIDSAGTSTPTITSKAYLTLAVANGGLKKVLIQKNPDWALPIASITKLMTAVVTLENTSPETQIKATKNYIGLDESAFVLETDKIYTVKELLTGMLVSSDNDSARLLSSTLGEVNFISKMNLKAQELGMSKTNFVNVTGLDPKKLTASANISSPNDLANLLIYINNKHPEILKLTTNIAYNFCDINGYCKMVSNTDKLLGGQDIKFKIVGGKTGTTDLALKNLALVTAPFADTLIINVVLGSQDNFKDTLSLINNIAIKK